MSYVLKWQVQRRLIILCAALLVGCTPSSPEAASVPPTVVVTTLHSTPVSLTHELPGRAKASMIADVRPQVDGIVARRLFAEGSLVRAGQPLYQLEDAPYRARVGCARAQVARVEAVLEAATLRADRITRLAHLQAVSQQDLETAVAERRQASAELDAARATLAAARVTLEQARITAPISGRIGASSVTQGALVRAGQTDALATVQALDPIHVDLTQSSAELLQFRRELAAGRLQDDRQIPVSILLEDGSVFMHKGTLAFADVSVDPSTGSVGLRASVANPEGLLLPGTYVRARVGGGIRTDALLVPMQGITREATGATLAMLVGNDGRVEMREVTLGRAVGDSWLVEAGLEPGDRLIVEGQQKLAAGMPVRSIERGATGAGETTPVSSGNAG